MWIKNVAAARVSILNRKILEMTKKEKQKVLDDIINYTFPPVVQQYISPRSTIGYAIDIQSTTNKIKFDEPIITETAIRNSPAFKRYVKELPALLVAWSNEKLDLIKKNKKKVMDKSIIADIVNEKLTKTQAEQFKELFGAHINTPY
jgi:hypothetical protein